MNILIREKLRRSAPVPHPSRIHPLRASLSPFFFIAPGSRRVRLNPFAFDSQALARIRLFILKRGRRVYKHLLALALCVRACWADTTGFFLGGIFILRGEITRDCAESARRWYDRVASAARPWKKRNIYSPGWNRLRSLACARARPRGCERRIGTFKAGFLPFPRITGDMRNGAMRWVACRENVR